MATDTCNALKVSIASLDNGTRQPACPRRCIPFPKGCNGECNYCIICSIGGAAVGLRTFTAVKVEAWSKSQVSCVGGPGEAELRVASRSVAICYSQYRFESAADKTRVFRQSVYRRLWRTTNHRSFFVCRLESNPPFNSRFQEFTSTRCFPPCNLRRLPTFEWEEGNY